MTTLETAPPIQSWDGFLDSFEWAQGEHVTLIGPTGQGKTTLALAILPQRDYVCVLAAKPRDPLISELKSEGYFVTRSWPPPEPRERFRKVVFWPSANKMSDFGRQRRAFQRALADMYSSGGWTIYVDEARYLMDFLGLKASCEVLWLQGRTQRISFVAGTQSPVWIPLSAYDQATHLFLWPDTDSRRIQRYAEFVPMHRQALEQTLGHLEQYQFLYVNTRSHRVAISKVDVREGG